MRRTASRRSNNWFNKANITVPTDSSQPFGNAPRNVARGPALYVLDMGLHKSFGLFGRSRLELRIEAFNVLNKTNLGAPERQRRRTPTSARSRRWRRRRGSSSSA